jgi:hypothetical protein
MNSLKSSARLLRTGTSKPSGEGTGTVGAIQLVHNESKKVLETLPIRPMGPEHRSFVLSTWVKSYLPYAKRLEGISKEVYLRCEPRTAERCTSLGITQVVTTPDDAYTVLAWVCGETGTLYNIYVIPEFRRMRLAGALIRLACDVGGGDEGTLEVEIARPWPFPTGPRGIRFQYNPYLKG